MNTIFNYTQILYLFSLLQNNNTFYLNKIFSLFLILYLLIYFLLVLETIIYLSSIIQFCNGKRHYPVKEEPNNQSG